MNFTDTEIIQKVLDSDSRVESEITWELINSLRGIVYSIVIHKGYGNETDVNGILNDSVSELIHLIRNGKVDPSRAKISTLFYSIARNKWLNRNRKKTILTTELHEFSIGADSSISRQLEKKELKDTVRKALSKLDSKCYSLIYKYWILDMSLKDIANELGVNENVIKKRHERCRKKLKNIIKNDPRNQ